MEANEVILKEQQPQGVELQEENYLGYISIIDQCLAKAGDNETTYATTLEALARIVDTAYNEGRLQQLQRIEGWEDNSALIDEFAYLQANVEAAFNVPIDMPNEAYNGDYIEEAQVVSDEEE